MSAQHTPGPWHAEWMPGSSLFAIRHESGRIAYTTQMLSRASQAREGEFAANALLLAAAPELLDLAYQYLSDLRRPPQGDSLQRRIERAEAIIAKARGQ